MTNHMNDYGTITGPGTIRFERLLPGPIERVWRYLTESEARSQWLASGEMELREGAEFTLRFLHASLSPHPEVIPEQYREFENGCELMCQVTRVDPPRLLSYTWGGDSEVTYELAPEGERVRLILTHRRLDDADMVSVASGWHTHLAILSDRLASRDPQPFWSEHSRFEEVYSRRLAPA
jgi:uncharacterized protein YndB with AHSA1/START domain